MCVGICTNGRQRLKKDTLRNIEETNEFVVNIMSSWFVESANYTCGNFPAEVDEMEIAGLATLPSDIIKPPRVADSAVQFECKVSNYFEFILKLAPWFNYLLLIFLSCIGGIHESYQK